MIAREKIEASAGRRAKGNVRPRSVGRSSRSTNWPTDLYPISQLDQ